MYSGRAAPNRRDLSDMRFGKLTAIAAVGYSKSGNVIWHCVCDCGNTTNVIGSKLINGHTKSCGCLRFSDDIKGESRTRLYHIWRNMWKRCTCPSNDNYKWYGGKGITVTQQWESYMEFRHWAYNNGYRDDLELDRIDSSGNYEPNNCRWITHLEQMNNVSSNRWLIYRKQRVTAAQFARMIGISYSRVKRKLSKGLKPEEIVKEFCK